MVLKNRRELNATNDYYHIIPYTACKYNVIVVFINTSSLSFIRVSFLLIVKLKPNIERAFFEFVARAQIIVEITRTEDTPLVRVTILLCKNTFLARK